MKKAYKWIHPTDFDGTYPDWAGYAFLDWSKLGYVHEGADYNKGYGEQDYGNPVWMPANGKMLWLGRNWPGYGTHCYTRHVLPDDSVVVCHFAHLKEWSILFGVGEEIDIGTQIAQIGNTGWNDMYSHLHFEIFKESHWIENVEPDLPEHAWWPNGWLPEEVKKVYYDPYYFIGDRVDLEEPDRCDPIKKKLAIVTTERNSLQKEVERLENQEYRFSEALAIFLSSLFGNKPSNGG